MPSLSTGTNPPINTTTDLSQQLQGVTLDNNNLLTEPDPNSNEAENDPPTYTYTEKATQQWDPTIDAICTAIRTAFSSSPHDPATTTRSEFQSYWHGVFTELLHKIAADATIPHHVTSPPVKEFEIKIFDKGHVGGCPCCLPDVDADILLENEDGVTKVDFVRGLRDYLFAEGTVPLVNAEGNEEGVIDMETALLYSAQWMNPFLNHDGVPELFLYCCSAERFEQILQQQQQQQEEEEEEEEEKERETEAEGEKGNEKPKGRPKTRTA